MHPVDLAIMVMYLAAMPAIGVLVGRKQRSAADYFIGERSLPWWAVCFSIVATETSTLTVISTPGLIWTASGSYKGLTYLQLPFGYIIGRTLVSFVLLPPTSGASSRPPTPSSASGSARSCRVCPRSRSSSRGSSPRACGCSRARSRSR